MAITPAAAPTASAATATAAAGAASASKTEESSSASSAAATKEAADRFLTLLVTQLRNQDPLNPMDNAQVTTQLAQISTVSGINQLNETVAGLAASFSAGQYLQATALVGRDVVVLGDKLALSEDKGRFALAIAKDAEALQVTIKNAAGMVVRTLDLGAQTSGIRHFEWDGKNGTGDAVPKGQYTIGVTATAKGEAVAVDALTVAKVSGIAPTSGGTMLTLGTLGTTALADVLEIN